MRHIDWTCFFSWMGISLYLILFWAWVFAPMPDREDFTDTGVGCVDDCLEPMEEPVTTMEA